MENKRDKLNQGVRAIVEFVTAAIHGESAMFASSLIFAAIAETAGKIDGKVWLEICEQALTPCTAKGCHCREIIGQSFRVLSKMRGDYLMTMKIGKSRCKRFADTKTSKRIKRRLELPSKSEPENEQGEN